jgi:hypothetical protein
MSYKDKYNVTLGEVPQEPEEQEQINKFRNQNLYYIQTSGRHYMDAKIFDSKRMADIQDQKIERHKKISSVWSNQRSPEISIKSPHERFTNFNLSYVGPFKSIFRAKEYILTQRMKYITNNIFELHLIGIRDPEIINMYMKKSGYKKIEKALENLRGKYPEFFI